MSGRGARGAGEPVDPDVDLHVPAQRAETSGRRFRSLLGAVACGGALGALARYACGLLLPLREGGFPWGTFTVNVVGCALIGVLMAAVAEDGRRAHPLARPFLGVGVLGGFTSFSTYALEATGLLETADPAGTALALAYLAATPVCALGAVLLGASATRAALAGRCETRRNRGQGGQLP